MVRESGIDMDMLLLFHMENPQGPAAQHGEVCSTLCDNLLVTRGKDGGRDSQEDWDGHGHMAGFNKENQQGPAVQPRELAQCHVAAGMGGQFGGEWIHVCV